MVNLYKLLADPTRRTILSLTAKREYTQKELVSSFDMSQPAIKKHIDMLIDEELILIRREGKYNYYRLNESLFEKEAIEVKKEINRILESKLGRLKDFLEEE
ncbi:ArsR/SmtB family transcription factor [Oceanobacillus sp. 1P07AA]|uniref:ArsR/SmtB family transcription factor n=1 Tax=Oceanobacillus sp. 1P07AA TaxID=3132293 RepID=UPI0039A625B6